MCLVVANDPTFSPILNTLEIIPMPDKDPLSTWLGRYTATGGDGLVLSLKHRMNLGGPAVTDDLRRLWHAENNTNDAFYVQDPTKGIGHTAISTSEDIQVLGPTFKLGRGAGAQLFLHIVHWCSCLEKEYMNGKKQLRQKMIQVPGKQCSPHWSYRRAHLWPGSTPGTCLRKSCPLTGLLTLRTLVLVGSHHTTIFREQAHMICFSWCGRAQMEQPSGGMRRKKKTFGVLSPGPLCVLLLCRT